jgi:hypothetical protein
MQTNQVNTEGTKQTFSVQIFDAGAAVTATDFFTLSGQDGLITRVTLVKITADATAASVLDFHLYKRTTQNVGGTFTFPDVVPHDSNNNLPAPTARLYSANPTALGTGLMIRADHLSLPAAALTGLPSVPIINDFGTRNSQSLVLRSSLESACLSLLGQAVPAGLSMYATFECTVELP